MKKPSARPTKTNKEEGLSSEDLKRQYEEMQKSGGIQGYTIDGLDFYKPRDGENCIRVVPPIEIKELRYYAKEVFFHDNVGINNAMFLCLKKMFSKACYTCGLLSPELWDEDEDLARSYYPRDRFLMWVLDLKADDPEKLLLWSCAKTLAKEIIGQSRKRDTDTVIDVSDIDSGVAVYFDKSGQRLQTKYTNVQIGDEPIPIEPDTLEQREKFEDILILPTYKDVEQESINTEPEAEDYEAPEPEEPKEPEGEDLNGMNRDELKAMIKNDNLDVKVFKSMSDQGIREKIMDALDSRAKEEPEELEEEPEEPESTSFLEEMNRDELKMMIKNDGLDIKIYKSMSDGDIIEKIKEAEGTSRSEPEEELEDDEMEKKKQAAKKKIKDAIVKNKEKRK